MEMLHGFENRTGIQEFAGRKIVWFAMDTSTIRMADRLLC
jgi:hypothetical protein